MKPIIRTPTVSQASRVKGGVNIIAHASFTVEVKVLGHTNQEVNEFLEQLGRQLAYTALQKPRQKRNNVAVVHTRVSL